MLRHQRSRAYCVEEPDHETDLGGRRNPPLLRWRENFASSTRDVNLRFCPSKPEHPFLKRKKNTGELAWKFSTATLKCSSSMRSISKPSQGARRMSKMPRGLPTCCNMVSSKRVLSLLALNESCVT